MRLRFVLILCLSVLSTEALGQAIDLPEHPLQGRIVFEEKGCIECHAVQGYGGDEGPDLSQDLYFGSFPHLAATIWNHTPEMDRKFRMMGVDRPRLTEEEFLSLTAFIFYLKYLGQPGSVSRGRRLVESKGCADCHRGTGDGAPDFARIEQNASPLFMVQSMWNHGPEMEADMADRDVAFPRLSGTEIEDIAAYIRVVAVQPSDIGMSPGSPVRGAELFVEKSCSDCHSVVGEGEKLGPDLSEFDMQRSVTEIAGSMWNHSPLMVEYMREEGIAWPVFEGKDMADVISYMYFLGFDGNPGDPDEGALVFRNNGCGWCHESSGDGVGSAPSSFPAFDSPVKLVQFMWNHAPAMEDEILIRNESWPRLTEREMENLFAFLRDLEREE